MAKKTTETLVINVAPAIEAIKKLDTTIEIHNKKVTQTTRSQDLLTRKTTTYLRETENSVIGIKKQTIAFEVLENGLKEMNIVVPKLTTNLKSLTAAVNAADYSKFNAFTKAVNSTVTKGKPFAAWEQ